MTDNKKLPELNGRLEQAKAEQEGEQSQENEARPADQRDERAVPARRPLFRS